MEAIKDTLQSVIEALEKKRSGAPQENPEELLKKVLTKKELGHIKFNYFKKGIFGLKVDSSSWLYLLTMQKKDLLLRLQKRIDGVKDLRLRLGE